MTHSRLLLLAALITAGCATRQTAPGPEPAAPEPVVSRAHDEAPMRRSSSSDASRRCLALAMYWEARGEGTKGMAAVGAVVLNRVADKRFPNTPCGVVHQGGETPPCQFSWWCDGRSDRPTQQGSWASSLAVADELLAHRLDDPTRGALFFHSVAVARPWRRTLTVRIGRHLFYR